MRSYSAMIDRRCFCCSIGGLAGEVVASQLPAGITRKSRMAPAAQEFLMVNGWVLTREDVAASEIAPNVI